MSLTMIGAILSDLGNVMVTFEPRRVAERLAQYLHRNDVDRIHEIVNGKEGRDLLHHFETGRIDALAYATEVEKRLGCAVFEDDFWDAHCCMFEVNQPVVDLWKRILSAHPEMKLIALSDCDPIRLNHVKQMVRLTFHGEAVSFRVGCGKPNIAMFNEAIRLSCTTAERCFYTDDILAYVTVARTLRINAHHYNPKENGKLTGELTRFRLL